MLWSILSLISCPGVTGRWGLLSCARTQSSGWSYWDSCIYICTHLTLVSCGHTPFCKRGKGGLVTALMQFAQRSAGPIIGWSQRSAGPITAQDQSQCSILSHEWHYHNIIKKVQHVNQLWNHKQLLCQSSQDSLSGYMQWKLPDPFPLLWDRVWPCKTNACTHDPTHTHTHRSRMSHWSRSQTISMVHTLGVLLRVWEWD